MDEVEDTDALEPIDPEDEDDINHERWRRSGLHMSLDEKSLIAEMFFKKQMKISEIAAALDRRHETILKYVRTLTDSTALAQQYLKSRAIDLVKRIVKKADVDQAIDILSRPNIGVLKPIQTSKEGPQILISVNQGSLGGVSAVPLHLPPSSANLIEGETTNATTGSALSDEERSTIGVSRETGGGGEEHEDRQNSHFGRVRGGRSEKEDARGEQEEAGDDAEPEGPSQERVPERRTNAVFPPIESSAPRRPARVLQHHRAVEGAGGAGLDKKKRKLVVVDKNPSRPVRPGSKIHTRYPIYE